MINRGKIRVAAKLGHKISLGVAYDNFVNRRFEQKKGFWCDFAGKTIDIWWISLKNRRFAWISSILQISRCVPLPQNPDQNRFWLENTPEMERSQVVRIQNIKFCNNPTILKKVLTWPKKIFFWPKKIFFRDGNEIAL